MHKNTKYFIELLWTMTEKELRARYKYTIFGFFWMAVNPILQMVIIYFVFSFFVKEPIPHYQFYLFIGLLIWNFFSLSLSKTTPCIVHDRFLIKKSNFPRSVIPLSIVLSNFIHFMIALMLFFIPVSFIGTVRIIQIPSLLFGLILLLSFTTGLSMLTSSLNVRFRDINFFVQAILIIWFYATPIVYSVSSIPYDFIWLWRLNPMTSVVQLMQYGFLQAPPPGIAMMTFNTLTTVLVFLVGFRIFRNESKNFDDWV